MKKNITISQIRKEVYDAWQTICDENDALHVPRTWKLSKAERERLPYTNQEFLAEIRQYGDLRRRSTWLKAAVRLIAHYWVIGGWADSIGLIAFYACPSGAASLVTQEVKAEMETHQDFWELAKAGLEKVLSEDEECSYRNNPGIDMIREWAARRSEQPSSSSDSLPAQLLPLPLSRI